MYVFGIYWGTKRILKILTVMSGPAQMSNWFLINSFVSAIMGHIYFLLTSPTFRRWKKVKPNLDNLVDNKQDALDIHKSKCR